MSKNVVVCLLIGDKYDQRYVRVLYEMVKRHCTIPYDFICYSDRNIPGINTVVIADPNELEPVWYKIKLLGDPLLSKYDCKVFFDLDIVIHNSIDVLFHAPVKLNVLESRWKHPQEVNSYLNTGCNSSIMVWNESKKICDLFETDVNMFMSKYTGMDRFLWHDAREHISFIQPGLAYTYSFGADLIDNTPYTMREAYSVCLYNQFPKPHTEINNEPAKSHWK